LTVPTRERIIDRVEFLTRARPKSPTLACPARLIKMFEDLHYRSAYHPAMQIAYISMDNRWRVGMEVLETLCNIKHEAELSISSDSDGQWKNGRLTSRFNVGQSTFRYSVSHVLDIVGRLTI
jgi:hypothetical protein